MVMLCLSAFFSGSETALFSLPPDEVKRMRGSGGVSGAIANLVDNPKRLLSAILFGNMLVNVCFFSVSFLVILGLSESVGPSISLLLGLASLVAVIVFGEVLPKNVAIVFCRSWSKVAATPLLFFLKLTSPFVQALEGITGWLIGLLGAHARPEPYIRSEELQMLVDLSAREGVLDRGAGEMIAEVFELSRIPVREVLVPRVSMVCFDVEEPVEELLELFVSSKLTYIPVYEGTVDDVLGVVHVKDVYLHGEEKGLRELVRPVPFVPESVTVEAVLRQLREKRSKMAFVVDEYGLLVGLVTMEDLLEEIVGEISDEYDVEERPAIERLDESKFRLRGDLSVRRWHEFFPQQALDFPVDTVGGLVMALLDKMPEPGDSVIYRDLHFTVEHVHGRRITSVVLELSNAVRVGEAVENA